MLRAYYDASVRRRLIFESEVETRAMKVVATEKNSLAAMKRAEQLLGERFSDPLHTRILTLGEALFQSIGMQLSVEKYKAIAIDRGACLDTLDYPLNNRIWLRNEFRKIRALGSEALRHEALRHIASWTNPGPGGFYDDLGHPGKQPHLVIGPSFAEDPGAMACPPASSILPTVPESDPDRRR